MGFFNRPISTPPSFTQPLSPPIPTTTCHRPNPSTPQNPHYPHPHSRKLRPLCHSASIAATIARNKITDAAIVDNMPKNSSRLQRIAQRLELRNILIKRLIRYVEEDIGDCPTSGVQYRYHKELRPIMDQYGNPVWRDWHIIWEMGQEQISSEQATLTDKRSCKDIPAGWPKVEVQSLKRLVE